MTRPLLVIGQTGQLARALAALRPDATFLNREQLDLSGEPDRLSSVLAEYLDRKSYAAMINAAAYTHVDKAETETGLSHAINAIAPGVFAGLCETRNLPFIHISTDYVFSGNPGRAWRPADKPHPINVYGKTKVDGEVSVLGQGGTVLRTSWVYDAEGPNFLTTMLTLASQKPALRVVDNQVGRPTFAADLAKAVLAVAKMPSPGLFHVSNTGEPASWADFAEAIMSVSGLEIPIERVPDSEFPRPAERPEWSVLDTSSFEETFVHRLPDWQDALKRALNQRD